MNKKKMIFSGIILLIGFILTGCAGYYGGYGYGEYPYYDNPYPSHNCPGDYGIQYCSH
jgi:hypothetical protein